MGALRIPCPSCRCLGPHLMLSPVTLVCGQCEYEWGNPFWPQADAPGNDRVVVDDDVPPWCGVGEAHYAHEGCEGIA